MSFNVSDLLNIDKNNKLKDSLLHIIIKKLKFKQAIRQRKHVKMSKELQKQEYKRQNSEDLTYHEYIKSRTWRKRRRKYFYKHLKECFVCKTRSNITLHHKYYGHYGKESDSDLVSLCWFHHEQLHKAIGITQKNMRKISDAYIQEMINNQRIVKEYNETYVNNCG